MRYRSLVAWIFLVIGLWNDVAMGASRQAQIVTRVDEATVVLRGRTLVIQALGMGRTPSGMGRAGRLVRRGEIATLNKDGLLEYNLVFNGVPNYSGFKLKLVKGRLREHQVPAGVKGVRIFGEFNQMDALLPTPKPKQRKSFLPFRKKREPDTSQETLGSITEPSPH